MISNNSEDNLIEFEQYEIYLYSKNGNYICNTKTKNIWYNNKENKDNGYNKDINNDSESIISYNIKNENDYIITKLIKEVCISDLKKSNKNEGIHYNNFIINNIKIMLVNIPITNLIAVGIFSKNTKSSIIRLFLLNIIVSFINYIGDRNEFFNSMEFKDINSKNKKNNYNFYNYLNFKIYDSFLSIPIQIHFEKVIQKVFRKKTLYIKDIYYKNYYLIDLSNNNKIILSLTSLYNNNKDNISDIKIYKHQKIWKEILFYCHNLKKDYIKKNKMIFNGLEYQNFYAKIEYKSTYPRRTFIIKFVPLLNGMCIIHEYIQLKYVTFKGNGKEKKEYKEKNIIYGYDSYDNIFRNNSDRYFENEHEVLKKVHFIIIESLFCSNSYFQNFFILNKKQKIYFSEEILQIINRQLNEYMKEKDKYSTYPKSEENNFYTKKIIQKIINILYEEYIQINNAEKILHKSSSVSQINLLTKSLSFKYIGTNEKSNSLQITKNEALTYLFNSIKFNKNINPNDITIDLNDERKSIKNNEFIDRNSKSSVRLTDLLSDIISVRLSNEKSKNNLPTINAPFPKDSQNIEYINTNEPLNSDEKFQNEEMSIGTKIRKKYHYKNKKEIYKIIYNNNSENDNNIILKKTSNESSLLRFLIDDKTSIENLNKNDKSDKKLTKIDDK